MARSNSQMLLPFGRRALLGLSSFSALSGLFPLLRKNAYAAGVPKRCLIFYTNHGVMRPDWMPTGGETNFTLAPLMKPFEAHKSKLLIFDNLAMKSADGDPLSTNAHYAGQTHALVCDNRVQEAVAGNISIDQLIAQRLRSTGVMTPLPSLELFVSDSGNFPEQNLQISYSGSSKPVTMELDPRRAYARVFPNGASAPKGTTPDPLQVAALAQRKGVLAGLKEEFAAVSRLMGKDGKDKLDAHASQIRDLEMSLSLGTNAPSNACTIPDKATVLDPVGTSLGGKNDKVFDAQMRIVVNALACDVTRVASINLYPPADRLWGYSNGQFGSSDMHDLIHRADPETNGDLRSNSGARSRVNEYHMLHSKWFAKMLDMMAQIPEADGKSLLDHTMVLWCGEIATGGHLLNRLPWLIAGSCGGYFKTGAFVKYPTSMAHNDLFVSMANAMDVPISTFGKASVCKGPLPGVKA